jgi:hypothetical protein
MKAPFVAVPVAAVRWVVGRWLDVVVPLVADEVLRRIDLDQVVARVDIDAVLSRVDLVGLVEDVLGAVDLPGIIRESTGVMMSDSVWRTRLRGAAADDAVARVRDRLLRRP